VQAGLLPRCSPLLNPYDEDPSCHLFASQAWLFAVPGSSTGVTTLSVVELNRPELVERRTEKVNSLWALADRWARLEPGLLKDLALNNLRAEVSEHREYSFILASFLRSAHVPV
jgi:hypothetical protein